ncbi:hypothetical protein LSUE1_G009441 [Lachnellula suecica]|uniref:Uncharacterized protein n=1 Tax=Lachnellula suecica TaxID=602035 RepID=A0A8T9BYA8_9HELO|nr:hypothetical protein LSUE1_G009441 [Lachnellula suecica]
MSAFPPHRTVPSIPVSQEIALKYLSSYLSATSTNPHLLPNARLEASGPTAGSSSSVTIHNLQRVETGLKGEWLAPTLELDEGKGVEVAGTAEESTEGWQDLEDYQREQSIEVGEVGPRQTRKVIEQGEDSDVEVSGQRVGDGEEDSEAEVPRKKVKTKHESAGVKTKSKKPKDVEARKADKKARHKERLRQKNVENANKNAEA